MRRSHGLFLLFACTLLLAAGCGGESTAWAPVPEPRSPVPTETVMPATAATTPEPTPATTSSPATSSNATPTPEPTPAPAVTAPPTPEPTPEPHGIKFMPIAHGEPRTLPADIALYYYAALPCSLCRPIPYDLRRVVVDEAAGDLRQERPLAFFDGMIDFFDFSSLDYGSQKLTSFGVSRSGQTMAVTLCHVGRCQVEPVGGTYPTADWELRLWVSGDGGLTWEDRGLLLPETVVIDVTDDDVLLRTWNFWRYADGKYTEHEREQMHERLEPLGLDALEPRVYWARWASAPEVSTPPGTEPRPPDPGGVRWRRAATLSSESTAWSAYAGGVYLLAIADGEGVVEHVLGSEEPLWGSPSALNDLVMSPVGLPPRHVPSVWVLQSGRSCCLLLDLTTSSIHPIDGLSVVVEVGLPEVDFEDGVYRLIAARPAPD